MTTFTPEASARVRALGYNAVKGFVERINFRQGQAALRYIRQDGFRRGSELEFERQRLTLSRRLTGEGADRPANDKDWDALARLWVAWTANAIGDDLLTDFVRKSCEAPEDESDVTIGAIAERCRELALQKRVSSDNLRLLMNFAPLELSSVEASALLAPSADELEITKIAMALPHRVDQLEHEVPALQRRLAELRGELSKFSSSLAALARDGVASERIDSDFAAIKKLTEAIGREAESAVKQLSAQAQSVNDLRTRVKALEGLKREQTSAIEELRSQLDGQFSELERNFQVLADERLIQQRPDDSPHVEEIHSMQVDRSGGGTADIARIANNGPLHKASTLYDTSLGLLSIDELANALALVHRNLTSMGIASSRSAQLAAEIIGASRMGQQITFAGSLGLIVAQVCAASLAGDMIYILDVPVGCPDVIESLELPIRGALLINNVNVASYDVYAPHLRRRIVESQVNRKAAGTPVLFAILAPPPAGLPPTPEFCELGPIIDTDALEWSDKTFVRPVQAAMVQVALEVPNYDEATELWKDVDAALSKLEYRKSELWRRLVVNAAASLFAVSEGSESDSKTVEASLLASWILPYLLASGADKAAVRAAIAQSAVFATVSSEPRIGAVLS